MGGAPSKPGARPRRQRLPPLPPPPPPAPTAADEGGKRIVVRNVKRVQLQEPPPDAGVYALAAANGRQACWTLGRETADAFAARHGLANLDDVFFNGSTVRVFFPVTAGGYYVTKTFKRLGKIRLLRILECVEQAAVLATAYYLTHDAGRPAVTNAEVGKALQAVKVCKLMLRRSGGGNQVYVVPSIVR